jgi:hypothetical protein
VSGATRRRSARMTPGPPCPPPFRRRSGALVVIDPRCCPARAAENGTIVTEMTRASLQTPLIHGSYWLETGSGLISYPSGDGVGGMLVRCAHGLGRS